MKRKLVSILLSVTMAAALLSGCGSAASTAASTAAPAATPAASEAASTAAASEASTAASTAASTDSASGDNTLTVWAWDQNFNIYAMNEAAKIYQKDHPDFKLNIVETSWDDMQTNLGTILGSGDTSQLPDVILMQDFAFQKYAKNYPE